MFVIGLMAGGTIARSCYEKPDSLDAFRRAGVRIIVSDDGTNMSLDIEGPTYQHAQYVYNNQKNRVGVLVLYGKLAPEFGLSGAVEKKSFNHLASGFNPSTGAKLTNRLRKDRNAFFDFTCSAPKSVSIVGLIVGDKRVLKRHQEASVKSEYTGH